MSVIYASGLKKKYGNLTAVDGFDISVDKGQIYGLIGADGAGKTTVLRMLAGILTPSDGCIDVPGTAGYVAQNFCLYGDLSVNENLDFYGSLYGLSRDELKARKIKLLDFVSLSNARDRLASALSGGMRQRLALAVALIHSPKIVLMDEPTNGVDPIARRALWQTIRQLTESGTAAVVSTQYIEEGELCDRVGLLSKGRLLACGTPEELRRSLPYQVYEVRVSSSDPFDLRGELSALSGVRCVRQFGSSLRLFCDDESFKGIEALNNGQADRVEPTLEDVFFWLAEGVANR